MPPVSEAQRRAMWAAASGHSTLGIPKKVGEEFVAADANRGQAAGTVFVAPDGEILLIKRNDPDGNYHGHWALPGGCADGNETAEECASREAAEELGNIAPDGQRLILDKRSTPNGMIFTTFAHPVEDKFWPVLNHEHNGAGWFSLDRLPRPMHPSVRATLSHQLQLGMADDMGPEAFDSAKSNFAAWARGEREERTEEDEHAQDGVHAPCHGNGCKACGWTGVANTNYWPMKPTTGAPPAFNGASDEWTEGDHPRADNGKFGSGSGSSGTKSQSSTGKSAGKKSKTSAESSTSTAAKASTTEKPALKMGELTKKGGKLGSNEGGLYEGGGSKFYLKKPGSKAHVSNERTAAALYQLAGAKTLDYRDVEGGEHVATEWKQLEKKNIADFTPAERKEAAADFAIHAWLSNWDAAGTGGDNQGVLGGKTTTLDVGGALRFRAQGGPKGSAFGDKVNEWTTMRDKGMSPDAARLFAPMTEAELKSSVERVTAIPDDKIRATVGGDKELADRLIARKKDLASKVGLAMDGRHSALRNWNRLAREEAARARRPNACLTCGGTGEVAGPGIQCDDCAGTGLVAMDGALLELEADLEMAFDRVMVMSIQRPGLAFDRAPATVRSVDPDGRMHVEVSNISKATVNPYLGKEIPKYKDLGLDPDRVYQLLRHPDELKKAAGTFNNLPLLDEHVGVNAADHKPEHVIGSTGTDAAFEHPHLKNSLVVWASRGIKAIESERKKELSSAYRYRADMTPGTFDGIRYDGVMRDLVGNHVALVEEGRAGSDVVVGDSSNPQISTRRKFVMSKRVLLSRMGTVCYGALMTHLQPMLAMDAKIDLTKALTGVTAKNFKDKRGSIADNVLKLVGNNFDPQYAQDGSIKQGLDEVLDMIQGMPKSATDEFPIPPKKDAAKDEKPMAGAKAEDEDMEDEDADEMSEDEEIEGESDEDKAKRLKAAAKDKKAKDEKAEEEKDKAMDSAIKKGISDGIAAERVRLEGISAAKDAVRPRVGHLTMAFDSAGDVYRKALVIAGAKEPPKSADVETLKYAFDNLPAPRRDAPQTPTFAMDSGGTAAADLAKVSPGLGALMDRIG